MSESSENLVRENQLKKAGEIIASACKWSAATAVIPMPLVDVAALAAVQASMVSEIAKLYGQSYSGDAAKSTVSVLLGTLLPSALLNGIKFTPGVGAIVGVASHAVVGAAASYAVGKVMVRHFENGGTVASFDAQSVGDELKMEFASAKGKVRPA
ncbi:MAG: YcjF family protein [Methylococcus sp.]